VKFMGPLHTWIVEFHSGSPPELAEKHEPTAVGSRRLIDLRHQALAGRPVGPARPPLSHSGEGGGVIAGIGGVNYDPEMAASASEST